MDKVTLRVLLEIFHSKGLDEEVRIKIGNEIYNITGVKESTKEGILIEAE